MVNVKVLIDGYLENDTGGVRVCPNIVLIRDKDLIVVVDPGSTPDPKTIAEKLKEEGFVIDDVNIVIVTHGHIDHTCNLGMFRRAKWIDFYGCLKGDLFGKRDNNITENIEIINTPGHSEDSITILVKNTKDGVIAICGDVFFKENHSGVDRHATDREKLEESRKLVLSLANYVIPGHGKMFKASGV